MKRSSWEIILAGFVFVGLAMYVAGNTSNSGYTPSPEASTDSIRIDMEGNNVKIIKLEKLKELQHLEKLESLENLKNLEKIGNFLPAEVRKDFETEIQQVIKEFEQESLEVNINTETGTLEIQRAISISPSGSWTSISPGVFAYVKEFDANELKGATMNIPFGSIEVSGKQGNKGKLTLKASGQISNKDELKSALEISEIIEQDGATFQVRSSSSQDNSNNLHLQAILTIPENLDLSVSTKAGHISSKNISGQQDYKTQGGHISLKELSGKVSAKTSGGNVSLDKSQGTFVLQSSGGHIQAKNTEGDLTMKTSGGNLRVSDLRGAVHAATNGGNIELQFQQLKGDSFASTGAGYIHINLPVNSDAQLELSGNSVEIPSAFSFNGQNSSGKASGTLGNGTQSLTAKTNFGKVVLKPVD